jgi:hypothetical protein
MTAAVRSLRPKPVAPLPPAVAEIGEIRFEGNIVPHRWYQQVTLPSGKPDMPAIAILSEIVYWYRPYQTLDKRGKPLLRKHFDGDMFQCTAAYFSSKFGFTKDQVRKALKRMEDAGYIRREYRCIVQQGVLRNNITFIEPLPPAIMAITHPGSAREMEPEGGDTLPPVGDTLSPVGDTLSLTGDIFIGIKTTPEISTETTTTTPNPSASNEATAETEPARGGGGVKDQNPKSQDSDQELVTLATIKQNPASQEEIQAVAATDENSDTFTESPPDEESVELVYPAKLSDAEREDIAKQVCTLPQEVAQQMLDVVQSHIQGGQVRKNPAAVLRGIVRKYRIDPDSFDPSSGFQIVAARRRRVENEWQIQRALEARNPVPLPSPLPPRQNGPRARPEGLKALLQVCHQRLHMPLPADCLNPA